jgi:hypothetical protein
MTEVDEKSGRQEESVTFEQSQRDIDPTETSMETHKKSFVIGNCDNTLDMSKATID